MAKKFGKFVLFTAAAAAAAATAYHFYQKKNSELDFDEDFDVPDTLIDDEDESIPVPQDAQEDPAEQEYQDGQGEQDSQDEQEDPDTQDGQDAQSSAAEAEIPVEAPAEGDVDFTPLSENVAEASFENAGEVKESEEQFF